MSQKAFLFFFAAILLSSIASSAHYIVGKVEDALDSTSPNGRTVVLWNPSIGPQDNLTDIVGPSGNSGVSNTYLIDCELLQTPCKVNDKLNITLIDDGSPYKARSPVQVTVTGAGFDIAPNISMNSPLSTSNLTVDDSIKNPANEIDLTPAGSANVLCTGVIVDYDGIGDLKNATAEFFSVNSSFFGDTQDNNFNYKNNSCDINASYGSSTEASVNCTFQVQYYANAEDWQCTLNLTDIFGTVTNSSDSTKINPLLAIGLNDTIDFGKVDALSISNETVIQVVNYGNIPINLSLSGYAETIGDGYSFSCDNGKIPVNETKYNLTASNPGAISYTQLNQWYKNLSSSPVVEPFNLAPRKNDTFNEASNKTYWRTYVPKGVAGNCTGNITIGAAAQ